MEAYDRGRLLKAPEASADRIGNTCYEMRKTWLLSTRVCDIFAVARLPENGDSSHSIEMLSADAESVPPE